MMEKKFGQRHVLELMGFLGFALLYSMRFNLSIAMVSMVNHNQVLADTKTRLNITSNSFSEPIGHETCPQNALLNTHASNYSNSNYNHTLDDLKQGASESITFFWTEGDQGLIFGSFFLGYVATQYPGGRLAHKYGAKWIFSVGVLLTGVCSLVTPIITIHFGKTGLIFIRVLQGLSGGVNFPAMHVFISHWAPPNERSRMANLIFSGVPIGSAITMVVGGYLIHFLGWPSMFYSFGSLSIVWFIFWIFLIFDQPSEHPRISAKELYFIESSIQGQAVKEDLPTPWKSIFRSLPFWSIFIIHVGHSWGHYLLHTEVPKYLHAVHNFNIENNGWFSAMPQFINFCSCIIISHVSDFLIVKKITSILFTRKLCSAIAMWGSGAAFIGMILGGCNTVIALVCLNLAGASLGATFGAWIVNNIDIAPNHSGSLMGFENSFSNVFGFLSPYVTGMILHWNPSLLGWKIAFLIPALINLTLTIFYLIFAKAEEQSWNRPQISKQASITGS